MLHTCRICSPATSMTPVGSCFERSQCCETSCNIWRSLRLLKSLPRVSIHLSQVFTGPLSRSRMKLEDGLEYNIFITVIIDDPIYCEKHINWFHSRHRQKVVSKFLIHHAPGATWPEPTKKKKSTVPSGHTSGTPSPCCPEGRPAI